MKISLSWIKDYVSFSLSVPELVHKLTMAGIEAEKIETVGKDTVIEFEITPNRPDCLNIVGIAREIAAVLKKPLIEPKTTKRLLPKQKSDVSIEAADVCKRYIGVVIEGVSVKASPVEIQTRLEALGNRPISNIVDITNYCLFELGHPLHAFDYDKLKGGKVIVRYARQGEKIVTLDGQECKLDPSVLVIADAERPVALAGIMGGANSEVTSSTKRILLESAWFDPVLIRRTSRKLGLASDSSYRFERGAVYENVEAGAGRAVDLILEHAGGKITAYKDVQKARTVKKKAPVTLKVSGANEFLGAKLSAAEMKRILKALGFQATAPSQNILRVTPPGFRADVRICEDCYEEIARVVGYDNLPSSLPLVTITSMRSNERRIKRSLVIDALLKQGLQEILTYSMVSREAHDKGACPQQGMTILNPLSQEQEMMRATLLPSFLSTIVHNINHGQKDLQIFETGKAYLPGGEKERLAIAMMGAAGNDWRETQKRACDLYDLKGAIEQVCAALRVGAPTFVPANDARYEDGQCARVFIGKKEIAIAGAVKADILKAWDVKAQEVFFAEVDLEALYAFKAKTKAYAALDQFPAVTRDVSLSIEKTIPFENIKDVIQSLDIQILKDILFKEEYLGEKIQAGQRGLVFTVVYQAQDRTLIETDVESTHQQVLNALVSNLGAALR